MVFAQDPRPANLKHDERVHELVLMSTTAFLDAYLLHSNEAKAWLANGFAKEMKSDGTFKHLSPK